MSPRAKRTAKRTRIQQINERKVLDAALEAFGRHGYRGATVEQIARLADMSKPNLLYYFADKQGLYTAVLSRTLETWLDPLEHLDSDGEPLDEIWSYVRTKLSMSRAQPRESRLFAMEVLQGAPVLEGVLKTRLKDLFDERCRVLQGWIDAGNLAAVDPPHLLFTIWAMTQTYADFSAQIEILADDGDDQAAVFAGAERTLKRLVLADLRPDAG